MQPAQRRNPLRRFLWSGHSKRKVCRALGSGEIALGHAVFRTADFCSQAGELLPIGALIGEKRFVDFAKAVFAAAKGGLDFGGKRKVGENVVHWKVKDGVRDGE